jgi:hypothetical protein
LLSIFAIMIFMQFLRFTTPLVLLGLAASCARNENSSFKAIETNTPASNPSSSVVPPPGMPVGTAGSLTPTPQLDAKITALEKKAGTKKPLAAAYAERGYKRMMDDAASPRVKYRAALGDFRHALELDPTNQKAKKHKAMIESIYKSMGRPIPTSDS